LKLASLALAVVLLLVLLVCPLAQADGNETAEVQLKVEVIAPGNATAEVQLRVRVVQPYQPPTREYRYYYVPPSRPSGPATVYSLPPTYPTYPTLPPGQVISVPPQGGSLCGLELGGIIVIIVILISLIIAILFLEKDRK